MLKIASVLCDSPLVLAPLAGYSDLPFRLLCREFGAGLCVSEMISCHGLAYNQEKTLKMLASHADERPVSFQLFGSDVAMMAKAADILNNFNPDIVDINMGCPVRKVTKKGAGAALMATPERAEEIIKEVVKNSKSPVTVKFRKGVDAKNLNCVDFAKMAQDCGASALAVHGRTWSQAFTGTADWQAVRSVKQSVSIPVIGNGDITSFEMAVEKMKSVGCDGVMIGRGALGNPWIFHKKGRPTQQAPIIRGLLRHLYLLEQHVDVERLFAVVKNHAGRYFRDLKGSSTMRRLVYDSKSFAELKEMLLSLEQGEFQVPDPTLDE